MIRGKHLIWAKFLSRMYKVARITSFLATLILAIVLVFSGGGNQSAEALTNCPTSVCVLDNGALRFGNGSENSINNAGNFQQPFYYSATTSSYTKLTYSNYPLDMAIGTGTTGSNWSGGSVTDLANASLSNRVIDYTGFTVTNTSGSVSKGYGTIVVSGQLTINAQTLRIQNTFTLGQTDAFVRIDTEITNQDVAPIQNLHIWVGTRDDWVGNSDGPTKTRGNLTGAGGAFQSITNRTDQAQAIQITTNSEGALFYSTTPNANTSINYCCSFSNAYQQNPITSELTLTGDGSYSAVLPAGNIPVASNALITWFYAAGSIADLSNVAQAVAAAAAPAVPTTVRGDQQVQVSWEAPRSADPIVNYGLRYSSDNGQHWTEVTSSPSSTATTKAVTGLTNGSTYIFQVRAISSNDNGVTTATGDWSASSAPVTLGTPESPSALQGTGGDTEISLAFTAPSSDISPITRYEYSLDGGTNWITTSPALATSPVILSGLTNGQQYTIKLRAVNAFGASIPATSAATVTKPAWITSAFSSSIRSGAAYSSQVTAGSVISSFSVASGALPTGVSLNSSSGVLSGTPSASGTFSFTIRASNAAGFIDAAQQLTVQPPLPTWTDSTLSTPIAADSYTDGVSAVHAILYEISSGSIPSGLALNAFTGAISGIPTQPGQSYSFVIKATAPGGNITRTFSGTVGIARPIWADVSLGQIRVGQTLTDGISALGASTYSISSGALPSGLSFNAQTGEITGTPSVSGTYSFTIQAVNVSGISSYVFSGAVSQASSAVLSQNGSTPVVVPGRSLVIEAGNPVSTSLQIVDQALQLSGTGFTMNIGGSCGERECSVKSDSSGNPYLVLSPEGQLTLDGDGFAPGSLVDVWMFSTPRYIGTALVGPNGSFSARFNLSSLAIPLGSHTLQASGLGTNGDQRVANLGLKIESVSLSATGIHNSPIYGSLWALMFLVLGAFLIALSSIHKRFTKE